MSLSEGLFGRKIGVSGSIVLVNVGLCWRMPNGVGIVLNPSGSTSVSVSSRREGFEPGRDGVHACEPEGVGVSKVSQALFVYCRFRGDGFTWPGVKGVNTMF